MQIMRLLLRLVVIACCCTTAATSLAAPQVEMVLLAEQSPATSTSGRKWGDLLTALGVGNLQIRSAQAGEKIGIEVRGIKETPIYRVTGRLTGSELVVPGGQFTLSDGPQIANWLRELGENGVAGVTEKKGAFGLLGKQLAAVRDDLAQPIGFQTKGLPPAQAIEKIRSQLKLKLVIDESVETAIAADDPVRDELSGLSCGVALAAIARPAGAILRPKKPSGGDVEYVLAKAAEASESWPIGWPPERSDVKVLPQLLDSLSVEIKDIPASQAIDAIQTRMKAPFLFDHNSIATQRINLAKAVTIPPAKKAYYATVLRQVLFQAGLKYVLRVDEAGKPLIWITTLKQ
jgi:hypothetical protein